VPHLSRREDRPEGDLLEVPLSADFLLEAQDRSILQQQIYDGT
jgi:hypothetical protein